MNRYQTYHRYVGYQHTILLSKEHQIGMDWNHLKNEEGTKEWQTFGSAYFACVICCCQLWFLSCFAWKNHVACICFKLSCTATVSTTQHCSPTILTPTWTCAPSIPIARCVTPSLNTCNTLWMPWIHQMDVMPQWLPHPLHNVQHLLHWPTTTIQQV